APCAAIHTFFMQFPIDVVFVRRNGEVLKVCSEVPPWRAAFSRGAFAAIELSSGRAAELGVKAGDRLELDRPVWFLPVDGRQPGRGKTRYLPLRTAARIALISVCSRGTRVAPPAATVELCEDVGRTSDTVSLCPSKARCRCIRI